MDVIVYDIQDIGARSYTYISTMGLVMEAAAEQGKEVVVLDRPNPLNGLRVEGPLVEEGYHSFVSQYAIPYVYGLTCGELAIYLNAEGLLKGGVRCKLRVVPMEGWRREMPASTLPPHTDRRVARGAPRGQHASRCRQTQRAPAIAPKGGAPDG